MPFEKVIKKKEDGHWEEYFLIPLLDWNRLTMKLRSKKLANDTCNDKLRRLREEYKELHFMHANQSRLNQESRNKIKVKLDSYIDEIDDLINKIIE